MQKTNKNQRYLTELPIDIDEISRIIDNLPIDKKQQLVHYLLGSQSELVVVLDSSNIINNINNLIDILNESSVEDIFKKLKNIPPQAIEKLIEAIALWVAHDKAAY